MLPRIRKTTEGQKGEVMDRCVKEILVYLVIGILTFGYAANREYTNTSGIGPTIIGIFCGSFWPLYLSFNAFRWARPEQRGVAISTESHRILREEIIQEPRSAGAKPGYRARSWPPYVVNATPEPGHRD